MGSSTAGNVGVKELTVYGQAWERDNRLRNVPQEVLVN